MWSLVQSFFLLTFLLLPMVWGGHFTNFDKLFNQDKQTASAPQSIKKTTSGKVVKVIDGDTIDVALDDGSGTARVRYIGMDTPEKATAKVLAQCGSLEATVRNTDLVSGKKVTLVQDKDDKDKYGRLLRYVYVGNIFVNEVLVKEGLARTLTIPPNTIFKYKFLALEETAQNNKAGMWGECFSLK
jgi:micrococcal nuclease